MAGPPQEAVQRAAGSTGEMNFGSTGVAPPKAASSRVAKVLRDCSVGLGVELIGRLDPALAMSVRHDHAGIDGEALAADKPFSHASPHYRLEQLAQEISIAEPAMARLGESRVIRHVAVQAKPTEPPIGEVQMDLFA